MRCKETRTRGERGTWVRGQEGKGLVWRRSPETRVSETHSPEIRVETEADRVEGGVRVLGPEERHGHRRRQREWRFGNVNDH